ncbi:MAG TPA: hypothetical protein GX692_00545 [Acholeplasmataceae bacterium]|nr:hypothetical protein [Acholeplasmataceae bacterium]
MRKSKGYFGLGYLVSIILAIIPITNLLFGVVIRLDKKKVLLAILNILIFPLFYLVDLISIIINNRLKYLI